MRVLGLVAPEDVAVAHEADLSSHVCVEIAGRVGSDELEVLLPAVVDVDNLT